jgi:uncharacterized protein YukE
VSSSLDVDPEALRLHASRIAGLAQRIQTVRDASGAIAQADSAFGPLCEWIAPILEEKHGHVDELIDQGIHNLETHVTALNGSAEDYETADADVASGFESLAGEL